MNPINGSVKIYLSSRFVDFRKAFEGLCGEVRDYLGREPLDGSLFVFYNRRRDRIKMLLWDNDGFWLFYKRLEQGTFQFPLHRVSLEHSWELSEAELQMILSGIELSTIRHRKRYHFAE